MPSSQACPLRMAGDRDSLIGMGFEAARVDCEYI